MLYPSVISAHFTWSIYRMYQNHFPNESHHPQVELWRDLNIAPHFGNTMITRMEPRKYFLYSSLSTRTFEIILTLDKASQTSFMNDPFDHKHELHKRFTYSKNSELTLYINGIWSACKMFTQTLFIILKGNLWRSSSKKRECLLIVCFLN